MKVRPDLVPETERDNLEIIQLTDEPIPSSHVYMEAQIFTPDSQRLILHRSAHSHGSRSQGPRAPVSDLQPRRQLQPDADHHRARNDGAVYLTRWQLPVLLRQ